MKNKLLMTICLLASSLFALQSCNSAGKKPQTSKVMDIVDDEDLYWFGEFDGRLHGKQLGFFHGQCEPNMPKTKDFCQTKLEFTAEDWVVPATNSAIDTAIKNAPDDYNLARGARPFDKDPNCIRLNDEYRVHTKLFDDIRDRNPKLIAQAKSDLDLAGSKYFPVLKAVKGYQSIIDKAKADLTANPADTDAQLVLNQNESAAAPFNAQLPQLEKTFKTYQDEIKKLESEINDAKKRESDFRTSLEAAVESAIQNFMLTIEHKTLVVERDQRLKKLNDYKTTVFPRLLARLKRTGLPIQMKDLDQDDQNLWSQFVKRTIR